MYQVHSQSPETWVFWVNASNEARFAQGYQSDQSIADNVRIPRRKDHEANIFALVHSWFQNSKEKWFLILDNIDDADFLVKTKENGDRSLEAYLPESQNGSILITSRIRTEAQNLADSRDVI